MANEISQQIRLSATNGNFVLPAIGTTKQITQTTRGGGVPGQITAVETGEGTLIDVSTLGLTATGVVYLKNTDPTNFVEYGPDDGAAAIVPFGKLKPGEEASFRLKPGVDWWIRADTAPCKVTVIILDD